MMARKPRAPALRRIASCAMARRASLVKLSFTKEALRAIAHEAMRRKAGARGLRAIMENAMLDIQYDVPYRDSIKECKITEGVIMRGEEPTLLFEKDRKTA